MSVIKNVRTALDRLQAGAALNLTTQVLTKDALQRAAALDQVTPAERGPLHGLPIVVKANIAVMGTLHDGASPALRNNTATSDATVVALLKAAGAVPVALTNMHELAFGITSDNAHYGPVRNPKDSTCMAGGSSGGTAAAIGAGAVSAGLASDTGGSGRLPAALCGCVGFRPSVGRYPSDGILTLSQTLDTISVMAVDTALVSRLDAAVTGDDQIPLVHKLVLGVVRDPFWRGISSEMNALGQAVLDQLASAGIVLVEIDEPRIDALVDTAGFPIAVRETAENWHRFAHEITGQTLADFARQIASSDVRALYEQMAAGDIPPAEAYRHAMTVARPRLQALLAESFARYGLDAMIFPTLIRTGMAVHENETVDVDGMTLPLFPAMTRRALAASVAGLPAISIPAGTCARGLPFGMELVGPEGSDRRLLSIGLAFERAIRRSERTGT